MNREHYIIESIYKNDVIILAKILEQKSKSSLIRSVKNMISNTGYWRYRLREAAKGARQEKLRRNGNESHYHCCEQIKLSDKFSLSLLEIAPLNMRMPCYAVW